MNPLESTIPSENGAQFGRFGLDKEYFGDLSATSKGEMMSAMTTVKDSAGYVAIEHVQGTLSGKKGSFVLQHFGIMDKGRDRLELEVVPDSGTDELVGLSGKMTISRESGGHEYGFDYEV